MQFIVIVEAEVNDGPIHIGPVSKEEGRLWLGTFARAIGLNYCDKDSATPAEKLLSALLGRDAMAGAPGGRIKAYLVPIRSIEDDQWYTDLIEKLEPPGG